MENHHLHGDVNGELLGHHQHQQQQQQQHHHHQYAQQQQQLYPPQYQHLHGMHPDAMYEQAGDEYGTEGPVKLFVGQVPRTMEEDDLRPVLEAFGPLEDIVVIRDKLTGAHRGCAFASFFSRDAAEKAIEELHNKVTLPNSINPLQVRPAEGQAGASQEHKLFIGMIPKAADEATIREVFVPFGAIEEVYILRHPTTGISKGCAFLKFKDRQSALDAIQQVNGLVTMERGTSALVVKFADSRRQRLQRARNLAAAAAAYWPGMPPQAAAMGAAAAAAGMPFPQQLQQLQAQYMQQMQAFGAQSGLNAAMNLNLNAAAAVAASQSVPGSPSNSFMYYNPYAFAGNAYGMNAGGALPGMGGGGFDAIHGGGMGGMPPTPQSTIGSPSSAATAAAAAVLSGVEAAAKASRTSSQLEGPTGANLFIYHLPHDLTDADLATAFAPFGTVISAKVYMDKITGESKGFGFVSYDAPDAADAAIASMNGFQIGSKRLKVQHKRIHMHGGSGPGGSRGSDGGYGGVSHEEMEYARMANLGGGDDEGGAAEEEQEEEHGGAGTSESALTEELDAAVAQLRIDA